MRKNRGLFLLGVSVIVFSTFSYIGCDRMRSSSNEGDASSEHKIKTPFVFSGERLSYNPVTSFTSGAVAEGPGSGVCAGVVDSSIPLIDGAVAVTSGCLVNFSVARHLNYSDVLNGFDPYMPSGGNILSPYSMRIDGDVANPNRFAISNLATRKWYLCNAAKTICSPENEPGNSAYLSLVGSTWKLLDWVQPTAMEFTQKGATFVLTAFREYLYLGGPQVSYTEIQRDANGLLLAVYDHNKARALVTFQYANGFLSKIIDEFGGETFPLYRDGYLSGVRTKGVNGVDVERLFSYGPERRLVAILEPTSAFLGFYRSANGIYLGSVEGYFAYGTVFPKRETVMCYRVVGDSFRVVTSNSENFIKTYKFKNTPRGHQVEIAKIHNVASTNAYDAAGQLVTSSGPGPAGTNDFSYAYSAAGHLKSVTTHGYKDFEVLTWQTLGNYALPKTVKNRNLGTTTYTYYSGTGRVASVTDPKGNVTQFSYNNLQASQAVNSLTPLVHNFNSLGMKTSTNVLGTLESWFYNPPYRLSSHTSTIGDVTNYAYNAKDQVTGVTGPGYNATANRDPSTGLIQSMTSDGVTKAYTRYPEGTVGDVRTYNAATEFKSHFRYEDGGYVGKTGENNLLVTRGKTLGSIPAPHFSCD